MSSYGIKIGRKSVLIPLNITLTKELCTCLSHTVFGFTQATDFTSVITGHPHENMGRTCLY